MLPDPLVLGRKTLLAVATPMEAQSLFAVAGPHGPPPTPADFRRVPPWTLIPIDDQTDLVVTGIGKANAAGATSRTLDPSRHSGVLSLGVCGTLGESTAGIGEVVTATACAFADEGLATPEGFTDCAGMGFPLGDFPGSAVPVTESWVAALADAGAKPVVIATVSTCSGRDALAREVDRRTGAAVEAMEGAAIALTAHRLGMACAELRSVSNTTGDRAQQRWDLPAALSALGAFVARLRAAHHR